MKFEEFERRDKPHQHQLYVRVPENLHYLIQAIAKKRNISVSGFVRDAILKALTKA